MKSKYFLLFLTCLIMYFPVFGQENTAQTKPEIPPSAPENIPSIQMPELPELPKPPELPEIPDMKKIQEEVNSKLKETMELQQEKLRELQETMQSEMEEKAAELNELTTWRNKFAQDIKQEGRLWGDYLSEDQEGRLWGDYLSEDIDIKIPANPGMSIILEHKFGNIDVRKGANNQIKITGEKKVSFRDKDSAKEFLEKMELKIEEKENKVEIKTYYPEKKDDKKIKNFSISYKIEIPENTDLNIESSFGNLDLKEVSGNFIISNGFGKLSAEDLTGETQLKNKFGTLTAENIKGETNIENSHGSLNIKDITGNLTASTKFGKININKIKGRAVVTGGHGNMIVENIEDEAELTNSFGSVICSNIGSKTEINNSHGKIEAKQINGDAKIINKFGSVDAENIKGDLYIENGHSPIKAKDISGNIDASNSFSPVTITNTGGNVIVSNKHGDINVKNVLEKESINERLVKLETSFGVISLDLPDHISAGIKASTTHGKIKCDFPVYLENTSSNYFNISAELGDAKDKIEIKGKNTNIYIEKHTSF